MQTLLHKLGVGIRFTLALAAAGLLVFSLIWVFVVRPLHERAGRKPGQTQISFIHWGDDTEDAIVQRIVDAFEKEHPEIIVQRVNPGNSPDVTRKVQTMVAAGDPPDLFYLGAEQVATWGSKGLLEPLEPYMERDVAQGVAGALRLADFYTNVVNCFRYDAELGVVGQGVLYGIPKDFTTLGFYYNKKLFAQAGVPEPPVDGWTWDEFLHAARAIGKLPNCYGADFVTWEAILTTYCWTQGAYTTHDAYRTFSFTDPQVVAALQELRGWFDEGRTLASAKTQIETSSDPFLRGNIGLAGPFGRWKVPVYREITDFEWDFAPLPHGAGVPPANGILTTAWAMSSQGKHKDAAWTFIRFVGGVPGQTLISETGLAIPAVISVAESAAFKGPEKPDHDSVYLDAVANAHPIAWPSDQRYLNTFRVRMEEAFKIGSKTVPEALAAIQRDWTEYRRSDVLSKDYPPMPWATITWVVGLMVAAFAIPGLLVWWVRRPGRIAHREELAGLLMISPWIIGFVALTAFPVVLSLFLSLTKWSGLATLGYADWVGLDNFRQMLNDDTFKRSLRITLLYALLAVPLGQLASLGAALLMNHEVRGVYIHRAAWYLPGVLAGVAMALLWARVFHHDYGLLNALLEPVCHLLNQLGGLLGQTWTLSPPRWFERDADAWGVPAFVIMSLWGIGGTMMIYLAGLKGIPTELYEAAQIDGATGPRRFVNVTLPMLSPVIFFNFIMAIIGSFQVFTQVYVMTGGGPGDATKLYVVNLYSQAFDLHEMGYASAMAWLLLLMVLVLTLVVMRGSRRFVYYEALK